MLHRPESCPVLRGQLPFCCDFLPKIYIVRINSGETVGLCEQCNCLLIGEKRCLFMWFVVQPREKEYIPNTQPLREVLNFIGVRFLKTNGIAISVLVMGDPQGIPLCPVVLAPEFFGF